MRAARAAAILARTAPDAPATSEAALVKEAFARLPLYFVENRGQSDARVAYYVQGRDTSVYFSREGLTLSFAHEAGVAARDEKQSGQQVFKTASKRPVARRYSLKLDFVGANPRVKIEGLEPAAAAVSYFRGKRSQWKAGLPTYSSLKYGDLWPGIDLIYSGTASELKYQFVVRPGADPGQIRLKYRGATTVDINPAGRMEVSTPARSFHDERPYSYQEINGSRAEVRSAYALEPPSLAGERAFGFRVGDYDRDRELVIDPAMVVYSGYIGGDQADEGRGIAIDGAGNAYVSGVTGSGDFPAAAGPDTSFNQGGTDGFVVKVKADGSALVYAGFIGGAAQDECMRIAVDAAGNAYVTGSTASTEASFPVAIGPDLTHNGGADAFVAKVNASGTQLLYCGYIGGASSDGGTDLAVDPAGNAYVTGFTSSNEVTFPAKVGPGRIYNEVTDFGDAFVARVSANGSQLTYAGYIGGVGRDAGLAIAVDGTGSAYVGGMTASSEATFPVKAGADMTYNGAGDAFVAKVAADGASLVYCGFIGGASIDAITGIAVDSAGNVYVSGLTGSEESSFPVTAGPDLTHNGEIDGFVARLGPSGAQLIYCGYIGGDCSDKAWSLAVDAGGNAYVVGGTCSDQATFPTTCGPDPSQNGGNLMGDGFLVKVNAFGTSIVYGGFVGGAGDDTATDVAVDGAGNVYITGETDSDPASFSAAGGPDLTYNGGRDAFVVKIAGISLTTSGASLPSAAANATVNVTSPGGCAWSAESNADFITIASGASGVGNGVVTLAVSANTTGSTRTGTITVSGMLFMVTQSGGPRIAGVERSGKKLTVTGEGFDNGAVILVNDNPQATTNDAASPATRLVSKKGGKKAKTGARVKVRNADGNESNEIVL
jgi:hypothetical protein